MLIFVYGSLKKGFSNHSLISPFKQVAKGTIQGRMYSLGAFPAIVLSDNPEELVHGEIYDVNTEYGLKTIDSLEGYNPDRKDNHFYLRVPTKCKTNTGEIIEVNVYCFAPEEESKSLNLRTKVDDGIWKQNRFWW